MRLRLLRIVNASPVPLADRVIEPTSRPGLDPTPSEEDRRLTRRLVEAGELLGIPLMDHVIIGRAGHCSVRPNSFATMSLPCSTAGIRVPACT